MVMNVVSVKSVNLSMKLVIAMQASTKLKGFMELCGLSRYNERRAVSHDHLS